MEPPKIIINLFFFLGNLCFGCVKEMSQRGGGNDFWGFIYFYVNLPLIGTIVDSKENFQSREL